MQDLLDKIEQGAAARPEHRVPPSLELVGFVVRWERSRRALEAGAQGLFTKPIDFAALKAEIDQRIEEHG